MNNKNQTIQTTITDEVPEWKLNLAYWYTENKFLIKRALLFAIFFIDLTVVFILGSVYVNYRAGLISDDNYLYMLPKNLVNNSAKLQSVPQALTIGEVKILRNTEENNNLLAIIKNDNTQWAVKKLTYVFTVNSQELGVASTFILPQSNKYLISFNAPIGTNVDLKIINTEWERIRDYSLVSYKDGLSISAIEFLPNQTGIISGEVNFVINNNTPYNFWEVGLPIVLYDQYGEPMAVNYTVINKLKSQEERPVSISWQEPLMRTVVNTSIYPEINLLDKASIMKIESGAGDPPGLEFNNK